MRRRAQVWLTPLNAGGANASLLHVLSALTSLTAVRLEAYAISDIKCCARTPGADAPFLAEWQMLCARSWGG